MFEKVSRSLKYDSNIFLVHKHIYNYISNTDNFTSLALRVWDIGGLLPTRLYVGCEGIIVVISLNASSL